MTSPHTDRLRMMRSMRKITAVLGETPIVETTSPAPQLLAPSNSNSGHKRGFFFHASSSLSSLALPFQKSDSSSNVPDPRPSLVLRVPDTYTFEPLPAPLSPSFSPTLLSPSSPSEPEPDRRRLCLAKVSRTLGETVPPELIFTAEPDIKRRRRASTLVLPESELEHQTFALQGAMAADGEQPRSTRRPVLNGGVKAIRRAMSFIMPTDVADTDAEAEDPTSPLGEVHVHPVVAFSPDAASPISHPEGSWLRSRPVSRATTPAPSRAFSPTPDAHREVAFAGLGAPPTYEESHQHGPVHPDSGPERSHTPMQRHEDDWTGEWRGAVGNMEDVVHKLRSLRVK
ncbi:hypothetical protein MVEN_01112600 [Mycena venus]|uniref:Uncharacterized protein n=1 Tax=Mycena venus TaxID=2733690 RepID=A0A8H6Y9C1_9AGAR|nr:hypothetical protein MVEN_01112600 [Mycena venus]